MRGFALSIAALLAVGTAHAQEAPPVVTGGCTVVPLLPAAIPVVTVTIAGKPYRFGIDTGAQGQGRIRETLAAELGLAQVGEVRTPAPGGTIATRPIFGVSEFGVGGMTFRNVSLVALSQVRGPQGADWDGILGIGLFEQLTLTLDYGNARAMIGAAGLASGLPLRMNRIPGITLTIAGKDLPVDLDTGNGAGALFLAEADARALPLGGEPVERGRARTSFGEFAIMEAPLAAPVLAGTATLPVKTVGWPPARPGGNLGSKGLVGMSVAVDQRAKRVDIHASGAMPVCVA
jgi:hypothetical protein